jgi:hypothetical protein
LALLGDSVGHPVPPPKGAVTANVDSWIRETWLGRWTNSVDKYRQTKIWFGKPNKSVAKSLLGMTRIELCTRIQFLTGHGWLNSHCRVVDKTTDPLFRLCGEADEDPDHLWRECPALCAERFSVVGAEAVGPVYPLSWTTSHLDRFLRIPSIVELTCPDRED